MFWERVERHYNAGSAHEFLLHFNVQDLLYDDVYGYLPALDYLMEQLNVLGCDLVLGYNTSQGIIWPNIGRRQNTQRMLKLIPTDQEGVPETERPKINANLAIDKPHEDPFINTDPEPSEGLQRQLNNLLRQGRAKVGLVINALEHLAPNDPSLSSGGHYDLQRFFSRIQNWASDLEIRRRKHIILLLTQNTYDIHPSLTVNPEIPVIEIPFPNRAQRRHFIHHLYAISDDASQMRKTLGDDRDRETLADETIGLNLFGVHDVVRQAESAEEKAGGEPLVRYRRESMKTFSHGVLELGETYTNPAANGWYVTWTIRDIAEGLKNGDLRRVPRGVLFLGPPGTSKLYAAQLLAGEANMTFVRLRYASQVGEVTINISENGNSYERNLNAAISFIRGISPVVVFIDEIEQAPPHTSLHPEERQPFPQSLVNAMSDASLHGRVIWAGASHRPDLMPQIFRQYGIFDTKFVMLPPIAEGRMEILRIFSEGQIEDGINFRGLVGGPDTDGLTWRDLFLIVQRANNIAKHHQRDHLTETDIRQALEDFIPAYSPEMQLFMGLLALREANSRRMIPDALLPAYQEFVDGNRIDKTGINRRLMELSDQLGLNV